MSTLEQLRTRLGDRYIIERELGRGGMGAVYLARDRRLDRPVALKVLPSEYAVVPTLRDRFLRETRMAAAFSHPNIVPVYAVEETDDLLAYVMGFVEGESLAERVNRAGPLSVRETVRLLQDAAYALAYAHGRGVVHRDIKPDNIMIERATGRALVMDFGVARAITAPVGGEGLTRVGEVVGTPEYMSPEQATGDHVDGRSDLYSLGLTAYFALTSSVAMSADSTGKVLARQLTEVLPPMSTVRPDLPATLGDAVDSCLAKDPGDRFANAEALVEALDAAQLMAPEIPIPIRLFAQEVGTLSMVLVFAAVLIGVVFGGTMDLDNLDQVLPVLLIFGVLFTRTLQTLNEARRLALAGFAPDDVHRGLTAVVAERQQRRVELSVDDTTRRARRRTLAWGSFMIVGALTMARLALIFRRQIGLHRYATSLPGVVLIVTASIWLGGGIVLLLRSPFRMPVGERLFRLVWLGPIGRAFLRFASGGVARSPAQRSTSGVRGVTPRPATPARPAPAVRTPPGAINGDRVAALESRVAELERWRTTSRS